MNCHVTVQQLAEYAGVTKSAVYAFLRKSNDIVKEHSTHIGKKWLFDEEVVRLVSIYYEKELPEQAPVNPKKQEQPSKDTTEVEALHRRIAELEEQLAEVKAEKKQIMDQLSVALLTLQQEKQEKQALLTDGTAAAPSIWQRIKGVFKIE